jgi:CheY-like chemotaxis protein
MCVLSDEEDNRKMLSTLVKRKGCECECAADGNEALEMILGNKQKFRLILMDNMMPTMRGVEATKILRENDFPYLVVGVTGNVMIEDIREFLNAGADMVLAKPFQMSKLDMLLRFIADNGCESQPRQQIIQQGKKFIWSKRLSDE